MQPRTTLVPGVPWPEVGEWPTRTTPSKVKAKATDDKFEMWKKKKKDALITGAELGLSIKQEIKQKIKKAEVYKRPSLEPREFHIYQKAKVSK